MKKAINYLFYTLFSLLVCAPVEICDNEIDDDGDGYVDSFDPDCDCNNTTYQSFCPISCEYIPDSIPNFQMKKKWHGDVIPPLDITYSTILTGDIDMDGDIEIATIARKPDGDKTYYILILNGADGTEESRIEIPNSGSFSIIHKIAMADIGNNGEVVFFVKFSRKPLRAIHSNGTQLWVANEEIKKADIPGIADFNGDGLVEVYVDDHIYNSYTGELLAKGIGDSETSFLFNVTINSIASDVLPHPGQELIDGNIVYEVSIINTNGLAGNSMTPVMAPAPVEEGFCSIADIDGDGLQDVIIHRDFETVEGKLWVWDPRKQEIIAEAPTFNRASVPFIGDVNNDCIADIGVISENRLRLYTYDGTDLLKLLWIKAVDDSSGATGITMFDFNQDGKNELIYRDEENVQILNGENGDLITQSKVQSTTFTEYPIVSDIDNDGEAEIIVHGYDEEIDYIGYIQVFESANKPWAPSRSVWNQYSYNVTNVNDDLTIPKQPQNPAAFFPSATNEPNPSCPQPYNTFLTQATYRTQDGHVHFPSIDLAFTISSSECTNNSIEICFGIENLSSEKDLVNETINVSFYYQNPLTLNTLIYEEDIIITIAANSLLTNQCITHANNFTNNIVFVSFNADNTQNPIEFPYSDIVECDYSNNLDSFIINLNTPLDLGDDKLLCSGDSLLLQAPEGYSSYQWNDGTLDSEILVTQEGTYSVSVSDLCGNSQWDEIKIMGSQDRDILMIEGDSIAYCIDAPVSLSLSQGNWIYENIIWSPSNIVDCANCENVQLTPTIETMITVTAEIDGCLYSDSLRITPKTAIQSNSFESICEGDSIYFGDSYYFTSGIYTFDSSIDCDTMHLLELEVTPITIDSFFESICYGDSLFFENQWLVDANTYIFINDNGADCQSKTQLKLTIMDSLYRDFNYDLCYGDTLFFKGKKYFDAGSYRAVVPNMNLCDSIFDINVNILEAPFYTLTKKLCVGDSIEVAGQYYYTDITDSIYTNSTLGCDSIIALDLSFIPMYDLKDSFNICPGDTLWIDSDPLTEEGTFTFMNFTSAGCDSTVVLDVSYYPVYTDSDSINICQGDTLLINGNMITESGVYTFNNSSVDGCDSISKVTVNLDSIQFYYETEYLCEGDSIVLNGSSIKAEGIYNDTVLNSSCNEIFQTEVLLLKSNDILEIVILCPGDSLIVENEVIYSSGSYEFKNLNSVGCDSIHTYVVETLSVPDPPKYHIDCDNNSVIYEIENNPTWNLQWSNGGTSISTSYSNPGAESIFLSSTDGCNFIYEFDVPSLPNIENLALLQDTVITGDDVLDISLDLDPDIWNVEWSSNLVGIDCTDCFDISVFSLESGYVKVDFLHNSGCIFTDSFYIEIVNSINEDIYIPNIFSPNGDHQNDHWSIISNNSDLVFDVFVYDRWGNKIAVWKNNSTINWDGKIKGQLATEGVYIYLIQYQINGLKQKIAGDFTLIR